MKKFLIPAFACTAAMFTACGDDSSSASSEAVESSSSVVAVSSSSDWAHEPIGEYLCISSDTTSILWYAFEGPDSAMEVTKYEYSRGYEEAEKICEELQAEKPDEQKVNCDSAIATINPPKTMNFDSFKALMEKECYGGLAINTVELTNPDEAPENSFWSSIKKVLVPPIIVPPVPTPVPNKTPENTSNDEEGLLELERLVESICVDDKIFAACYTYCSLANDHSHLPICTEEFEYCIHEPDLPECAGAFTPSL